MSSDPVWSVLLGDPRLPDPAKPGDAFTAEDLESVARLRAALDGLDGRRFVYHDDHGTLLPRLLEGPPLRAVNFCDTGFRNRARQEPHLAAFLEMLDVPYTGAGPGALALCYDKAAVSAVARALDVPVPAERLLPRDGPDPAGEAEGVPLPALVKPATGDGSEGIEPASVVRVPAELSERVRALREAFPDRDLLVQEFLPGDEYAVGLVGNPGHGFVVLPPLRVDYGSLDPGLPPILSYGSKTDPRSPYWTDVRYEAADLSAAARDAVVAASERLFARLGCRDYARFDFREDAAGTPRLLEVNPNPAWCWDGKMNLMAGLAGWSYGRFLEEILDTAERRWEEEGRGAVGRA